MNKKFNLILLFIFISCILLTCFILPSNAASQTIVTAGGNQFILNDVREAWSYAVYLATRHGEAKITLGDNFYAFDSICINLNIKYYADIAGIPVFDLNNLELYLCVKLKCSLFVDYDIYQKYFDYFSKYNYDENNEAQEININSKSK